MREWNAEAYHRVSDPQLQWGVAVLARLPLRGDELVIDVGCGTGRLTERLFDRLPTGRAIATDLSQNMVAAARAYLQPRVGRRVQVVRADATALPFAAEADAVFSTATFHWVLDHDALFGSLFAALAPGGRLVAQCGGGPNIARVRERCAALMAEPPFSPHFTTWREPWLFADAATTAQRLEAAGFIDVRTSLAHTPVVQKDGATYREFVANVVCHHHLEALPATLRARFMDTVTTWASQDAPAFELDYWRLNMEARKP